MYGMKTTLNKVKEWLDEEPDCADCGAVVDQLIADHQEDRARLQSVLLRADLLLGGAV